MKKISENVNNIYHVNVYETVENLDDFWGEEYIDILDIVVEADEDEDVLGYYCNMYKDNKGYTVSVTLMDDNNNRSGWRKIK